MMVCKRTAGMATLRHDIWAFNWLSPIRQAGCTSGVDPEYISLLVAHNQHSGSGSLRCGDILAVQPEGCDIVLDCVVTHHAVSSYIHGLISHGGLAVL